MIVAIFKACCLQRKPRSPPDRFTHDVFHFPHSWFKRVIFCFGYAFVMYVCDHGEACLEFEFKQRLRQYVSCDALVRILKDFAAMTRDLIPLMGFLILAP